MGATTLDREAVWRILKAYLLRPDPGDPDVVKDTYRFSTSFTQTAGVSAEDEQTQTLVETLRFVGTLLVYGGKTSPPARVELVWEPDTFPPAWRLDFDWGDE